MCFIEGAGAVDAAARGSSSVDGIAGRGARRAGCRLRPLFNRVASVERPVVVPSWRTTPVSLLWPRVSCSLSVSLQLLSVAS